MKRLVLPLDWFAVLTLLLAPGLPAAEWHVALRGDDAAPGTEAAPLRTIQKAADRAEPGDTITVHQGIYRERVNPPRGGTSEDRRIIYRAAPGETVEIAGSEVVTGWSSVSNGVWKVSLPDSFFGDFNPYRDLIRGDWFEPKGRPHHTGAVYLDGEWLVEASRLGEVLAGAGDVAAGEARIPAGRCLWYAESDAEAGRTTLWAQFPGVDPNSGRVEINVRRTVFYPDRPGRNFITVRGFVLRQAATPWAPPTAEQIGLIGTHWSKGWIIEDNVVRHSVCSGIALGKYGDRWDNTSANTAEGYVKTIERALANGWDRETIGHHQVRNNRISHCEQAGIVGSLGAAFSTVSGNVIHDIHVRRLFTGAEMAGIKFHAAIDSVIRSNHIHHTCLGLWLDWMAQGTRVSGNLFHDNAGQDLFVEVNHGPFLVDNNVFLSPVSLLDMSEGGAFVHNLFGGKLISRPEPGRETPYHPAHSTAVAGLARIEGGDHRFLNNLFVGGRDSGIGSGSAGHTDPEWRGGYGLWVYDFRSPPLRTGGNVYFKGARAYGREENARLEAGRDPAMEWELTGGMLRFSAEFGEGLDGAPSAPVTSEVLGRARVPGLPFEAADGSPVRVQADIQGRPRSATRPTPGPFEGIGSGRVEVRLR